MCGGHSNFHINIVKGDFIINEWDDDGYGKLEEKQKELELAGYTLKEKNNDYLNDYFLYENANKEEKMITFCRC